MCTQDREIRSESGRLPEYLGELAYLRRLLSKLALDIPVLSIVVSITQPYEDWNTDHI